MSNGKQQPPPPKAPRPFPRWGFLIWYVLLAFFLLWIWRGSVNQMTVRTIPYSAFKGYLARGEVVDALVKETEITGTIRLKPGNRTPGTHAVASSADKADKAEQPTHPTATTNSAAGASEKQKTNASAAKDTEEALPANFQFRTVRVDDPKLVEELEAAGVKYSGSRPAVFTQFLLAWILPIGLIVVLWIFISRRMGAAGQSVLSFGKSKARLNVDRNTGVNFKDVAGCDEAKFELQEVVEFLKSPGRYKALGAKIPKGVLLVGPPGTGKTLLARAVAGEAAVPFFSLSGSDFVEMFVGVGAARVRDLFQQAKAQAPCIIFIDELDAIGRQRGVHVGAVNDEREQTLNALLVEMDGFEPNTGIILLAATNRPDVLDRALLRPGRFDRQVIVDAPDLDGREAILKVHARDKRLGSDVDLRQIAKGTPGFSGADLANSLNEAALLAARRHGSEINQSDLEEAVEKVVAGPERKSRRLNEQEKRRVAYHEVGHAIVAAYSAHADPVHKISVVPRGRAALGYTLQLPTDEQFLMSESELKDRIRGLLGGRAAEEIVFREVTTGAENDLERATTMARQMVCLYGMSEAVGLTHCGQRSNPVFLNHIDGALQRDCSEDTAREIDAEVKRILEETYQEAREILHHHRSQLDLVTDELLKRETMDGKTFHKLIGVAQKKEQETVPTVIPQVT